jgi:hypothetical protein
MQSLEWNERYALMNASVNEYKGLKHLSEAREKLKESEKGKVNAYCWRSSVGSVVG